jgi:hypothetical protein
LTEPSKHQPLLEIGAPQAGSFENHLVGLTQVEELSSDALGGFSLSAGLGYFEGGIQQVAQRALVLQVVQAVDPVEVVVVGKEDKICHRDVDGLAQLSVVLAGFDRSVDEIGGLVERAFAISDLGLDLNFDVVDPSVAVPGFDIEGGAFVFEAFFLTEGIEQGDVRAVASKTEGVGLWRAVGWRMNLLRQASTQAMLDWGSAQAGCLRMTPPS